MAGLSEKKLANVIQANGLSRSAALVLACFKDGEEMTMTDIQIRAHLQQPEVSIGSAYLRKNGWLKFRAVKQPGKGRPYLKVRLAMPYRDVIQEIADRRAAELKAQEQNVIAMLQAVAVA